VLVKETAVIASRVIDELKERLSAAYGVPLHAVVLFGSEARGNAGLNSDIDALSVLGNLSGDYGDELERGLGAVYPVALRSGRRVSVKPLAREEYEQGDSPLLREVRCTGGRCHIRCHAA
jgi:predicted nucleotidyltransferase